MYVITLFTCRDMMRFLLVIPLGSFLFTLKFRTMVLVCGICYWTNGVIINLPLLWHDKPSFVLCFLL